MTISHELTERQSLFVTEYCVSGNAAAAARAAGYSDTVARQTAHKLLLKPHIALAVRRQASAMIDTHLPSAVATLANIMQDPEVDARDRVRAAEVLLKHGRSANGPAVALQVNVGRGATEAQSIIQQVWTNREQRLAAEATVLIGSNVMQA